MLVIPVAPLRCIQRIRWNRRHLSIFIRTLSQYQMVCGCFFRLSALQLPLRTLTFNGFSRKYVISPRKKCWNCHKNLETIKFSCLNCGVLQHPDPKMNYFELLDLPINFELENEDISSKYKALQMIFHPDRFVHKSQEEMGISDLYSKLVNKAYSTLKNPLSRGLYMLHLRGITTDDESVKMNKEFLMEILETNEELEKINDVGALTKLSEENSEKIFEHIMLASRAFEGNNLNAARDVLMKMKYFVNIETEIKKKKSILGIVD